MNIEVDNRDIINIAITKFMTVIKQKITATSQITDCVTPALTIPFPFSSKLLFLPSLVFASRLFKEVSSSPVIEGNSFPTLYREWLKNFTQMLTE